MANRRQFRRVKTEISAKISVLIPEDTFSPPALDCLVCDISERGAMVALDVPEPLYTQLLQRVRHCRLTMPVDAGLPERLVGKAVWIQPEKNGSSRIRIGLFFEECAEPAVLKIRQYVESMLANRA